jgi:hypothetical protein
MSLLGRSRCIVSAKDGCFIVAKKELRSCQVGIQSYFATLVVSFHVSFPESRREGVGKQEQEDQHHIIPFLFFYFFLPLYIYIQYI